MSKEFWKGFIEGCILGLVVGLPFLIAEAIALL